jgi:glycerol-3-phosphate cytidylyltransferase
MKYGDSGEALIVGVVFSSFDLLHAGHIMMLEEAKTQCDWLVAALQSDPTWDRPEKNRPIQTMYERYIQLKGCKYVDEIIPYTTEEEVRLILESRPFDVRIIGEDYKNMDFTGKDICGERGIRIYYNSRQHHLSSSELRKRIKDK